MITHLHYVLKPCARLLLLSVLIATLSACKHTMMVNGDHLPPKLMQQVLMDINVAEAYSTMRYDGQHRPGTKNIDSLSVYYKDIFAHYKISEEEFKESLDWYKSNPDQLDSLYTSNIQIISKWQVTHPTLPKANVPVAAAPRPLPMPMDTAANSRAARMNLMRNKMQQRALQAEAKKADSVRSGK